MGVSCQQRSRGRVVGGSYSIHTGVLSKLSEHVGLEEGSQLPVCYGYRLVFYRMLVHKYCRRVYLLRAAWRACGRFLSDEPRMPPCDFKPLPFEVSRVLFFSAIR